ncbi:hypothetical protein RBG61_06495 [Paludicola sp. MB14-C6]|uniref:hypothetical protein n=1 Tax=Paludihabitans sp. MB14-C6 TaxID=3070656 RepID=UPI0027DC368A|nr:hypothetical protein [Paludicola sp. MB14-C6]WMJ24310.1 hypothetical protein RBG61_06495 [Paludicola sp. MB14-C6]
MQRLRKLIFSLFIVIFVTLQGITVFAYNQPSANSYDFECSHIELLTDTIREENVFKVKAVFNYYAVNNGYWYQPPDIWVTCSDCGGSGNKQCPNCGGSGGTYQPVDIPCNAPGQPRCQSSCDGWDYECSICHHIQTSDCGERNYCAHVYTAHQIRVRKCSCETGETENVWFPCPSCNGGGTITCPSCGGSGGHYETPPMQWIPPTRPSTGTTKIDFLIDGKVQCTKDVEIQINKENVSSSWEVWGTINVEAELNAGENIGTKNVEARINWDYRNREINANNNSKSTSINVIPATNLKIEMMEPNAPYRTDTDVITTYRIINQDDIGALNIRPKHNLTAIFKTLNSTTNELISKSKVEGIVIPMQGTNIVYFKWHVPKDYQEDNIKLQCEINTSKGVNETNYNDNVVIGTNEVQKTFVMDTPDTVFESRPYWFSPPNGNEKVDTLAKTEINNASWEVWKWDNKTAWYRKETYGLSVNTEQKITPNENCPSKQLLAKDIWQIRSGYGFSLNVQTSMTYHKETKMPSTNAFTSIQHANAYFPEYKYNNGHGRYRTLEQTNQNKFEFYTNENTITNTGTKDYKRVHFTPLWYPDGEYIIKIYIYDCWTPLGMLSMTSNTNPIQIKGNMYDDWYISHSKQIP